MLGQAPRVRARAMVSDTTRNAVWQELLDAARLVRYYTNLADRYLKKRRTMQFLLIAAAASGIAGLLGPLPEFISRAAAAAVAILVVWDVFGDYARKAAVLHAISIECNRIESLWHALWLEIDRSDLEDADVLGQCKTLGQSLNDVTGRAGLVGVEVDAELNVSCAEETYKVMQERYAS